MIQAIKDNNGINSALAILNTSALTPSLLKAREGFHALHMSNGTTGSDYGGTPAKRDDNMVPVIMALSETDGVTPVALYCDSDGKLLVDTT